MAPDSWPISIMIAVSDDDLLHPTTCTRPSLKQGRLILTMCGDFVFLNGFRGKPMFERFRRRLEPSLRGGRKALVHLDPGAAAGVIGIM